MQGEIQKDKYNCKEKYRRRNIIAREKFPENADEELIPGIARRNSKSAGYSIECTR